MAGNSFGKLFRLTTFGESHGGAIGGIIDGCPSNVKLDLNEIQVELDRRKPGQSTITTQRKETDEVLFLSGILDGVTLGTPIGFTIQNQDQKSKDYNHIAQQFRPSHADFTFQEKYGVRDYRGGGRSSARETAARVAAGAVAKQFLAQAFGAEFYAYVSQVGNLKLEKPYNELDLTKIDTNDVRCPDGPMATEMFELIDRVRKAQDTIGGVVTGVIKKVPAGYKEGYPMGKIFILMWHLSLSQPLCKIRKVLITRAMRLLFRAKGVTILVWYQGQYRLWKLCRHSS